MSIVVEVKSPLYVMETSEITGSVLLTFTVVVSVAVPPYPSVTSTVQVMVSPGVTIVESN